MTYGFNCNEGGGAHEASLRSMLRQYLHLTSVSLQRHAVTLNEETVESREGIELSVRRDGGVLLFTQGRDWRGH